MRFSQVSKRFPSAAGGVEVFREFSLSVSPGQVTVILGPSGCGKTTLLHLAAGLLLPDSGRVIRSDGGGSAECSFIFQEPRLLRWMSVAQNIDLVLRTAYPDRDERAERISRVLEMVGLQAAAALVPGELSGGMRQRVSIARAFAYPSGLILMDEPFQSLDLKLRVALIREYLGLWEQDRRTTLMVTHDVREALLMGDTVCLLSERPAELVECFPVPGDKRERSLGDAEMTALEQRMYRAMGLA